VRGGVCGVGGQLMAEGVQGAVQALHLSSAAEEGPQVKLICAASRRSTAYEA